MRLIFLFLLGLMSGTGSLVQGQAVRVSGGVFDEVSQEAVPLAFISSMRNPALRTTTDSAGRFSLSITAGDTLLVQCTGYDKLLAAAGDGSRQLRIFLHPSVELEPIEIQAGVRRLLDDETIQVFDYAIMGDQLVLLLRYSGAQRSVLQLATLWGKRLSRQLILPEEPGALFTDCEGNLYALGSEKVFKLHREGSRSLEFTTIDGREFHDLIEPCTAELQGSYFFKVKTDKQHAAYVYVTQEESRPRPLVLIEDSLAMAMIYDDSLMAAKKLGWSPEDASRAAFAAGLDERFRDHVWLAPVNAPMTVLGDSVYVFDHENGLIMPFAADGGPGHSVSIRYPKDRHWARMLVTDEEGSRVFAVFEKHGYYSLAQVNPLTGECNPLAGTELAHPFATRIRVKGDFIYFLYRDNVYDPVKRVYRQPLGH